jgi:hypothetical protein
MLKVVLDKMIAPLAMSVDDALMAVCRSPPPGTGTGTSTGSVVLLGQRFQRRLAVPDDLGTRIGGLDRLQQDRQVRELFKMSRSEYNARLTWAWPMASVSALATSSEDMNLMKSAAVRLLAA